MAIVLDVNMLCEEVLKINVIEELINDYKIKIKSINSIENWGWDNEQQIDALNQVTEVIKENKIIVINFISSLFKDLGLYIEKTDNSYLYTFWINTEGYPELDCDTVNSYNKKYYEIIYRVISKLNNESLKSIKVIGIGLETNFCSTGTLQNIIQNSRNIVVWILNSDSNIKKLESYQIKAINSTSKILFEKIK